MDQLPLILWFILFLLFHPIHFYLKLFILLLVRISYPSYTPIIILVIVLRLLFLF